MRLVELLLPLIILNPASTSLAQQQDAKQDERQRSGTGKEESEANTQRPADLQRLVSQYGKETRQLNEAHEKQRDELSGKLRSDLKKLQDKYTREALLDEAVAIRDCLRQTSNNSQFSETLKFLKADNDALPTDALSLVNRFVAAAEELTGKQDEATGAANDLYQSRLRELLEKYAKSADLNAALAVREVLNGVSDSKTKTNVPLEKTQEIELDLTFPPGLDAAEGKYREQLSRLQQHQQQQVSVLSKSLIEKLRSEQDSVTRAGNLDEAVVIRDLVKLLEAQKGAPPTVDVVQGASKRMSDGGRKIASEYIQGCNEIAADFQQQTSRLNQAFTPLIEAPLKAALKAGDEPKSKSLLERHLSLRRQPPIAYYQHQKAGLSKEAIDLIEPFEAATAERKAACEAAEAPLRNRLLEGLRGMVAGDASPPEDVGAKAIDAAIAFFSADYTDGPQRGRLYVPDSKLPEQAAELFNEYCRETVKLEQQLSADQVAAANQLRETLKPVVAKHVDASEFPEAWRILARGIEFDRIGFETTVKFAHVPHWKDHLTDAVLLDVRKDAVLLRTSPHQPGGEWYPRGRIKFAPSDTIAETKFGDPTPGPGSPVTDKTLLKRGQTVFYVWGRSALEATIVDLTESQAVLRYKERWHNETVLRTQLWIISDY